MRRFIYKPKIGIVNLSNPNNVKKYATLLDGVNCLQFDMPDFGNADAMFDFFDQTYPATYAGYDWGVLQTSKYYAKTQNKIGNNTGDVERGKCIYLYTPLLHGITKLGTTHLSLNYKVDKLATTVLSIDYKTTKLPATVLSLHNKVNKLPATTLACNYKIAKLPATTLAINYNGKIKLATTSLDLTYNILMLPKTTIAVKYAPRQLPATVLTLNRQKTIYKWVNPVAMNAASTELCTFGSNARVNTGSTISAGTYAITTPFNGCTRNVTYSMTGLLEVRDINTGAIHYTTCTGLTWITAGGSTYFRLFTAEGNYTFSGSQSQTIEKE